MSFTASDIFKRVRILLQDEASDRWPLPELLLWLNDGAREIALLKPTATATTVVLPLAQGTYQVLPDGYLSIMRAVRNITSGDAPARVGGRPVKPVDHELLDAQAPGWHDPTIIPQAVAVKHVVFDQVNPTVFYVYPGNTGAGRMEVVLSRMPEIIEEPVTADDIDEYSTSVDLPDIYANALVDYVMYRAFTKDMAAGGNAARATMHYQQFSQALGIKITAEARANVNVKPQGENAA
ncbi:DUF6682 family protein [Xanthobacter sp. DSM 24535]|uniref:phage adaptor protein n=1 Tax=Roseixanthobacter psychrophilus TaxID=3119917 RepID=UPI0037265D80